MNNLSENLKRFTGSDTFYRHPLYRKYGYTEGVRYLAKESGSYWLIDYVFSNQHEPKIRNENFQVWKLKVNEDKTAVIKVEGGNKNVIKRFPLSFTDFPLNEISLWFTGGTLMLPSEY